MVDILFLLPRSHYMHDKYDYDYERLPYLSLASDWHPLLSTAATTCTTSMTTSVYRRCRLPSTPLHVPSSAHSLCGCILSLLPRSHYMHDKFDYERLQMVSLSAC